MYPNLFLILFILKVVESISDDEANKPLIEDLYVSSKLIEGKKLFLPCLMTNDDKHSSRFEWFFNKQKIEPTDNIYINDLKGSSILNINSMTIENSGLYTCEVTNSYGSSSKSINLNLNVKPKFKKQPEDKFVKMNSEVEVDCDANAVPEARIKIQRLSSRGDLEQEYEQKVLKFNSTRTSSKRFRCIAENELGLIQKDVTIKHYGKF